MQRSDPAVARFLSFNPQTYIYKLTRTPTMVQGGYGTPLLVFVFLNKLNLNLHWLHSSELALQDDTTFVGYDVLWHKMTSFNLPHWIRHLGFCYISVIFFIILLFYYCFFTKIYLIVGMLDYWQFLCQLTNLLHVASLWIIIKGNETVILFPIERFRGTDTEILIQSGFSIKTKEITDS